MSRRVARTQIDDIQVSTIALCVDHSNGQGPPLLFETMVFGGPLDMEQERYTTEAEALGGHARHVATVEAALDERRAVLDGPLSWICGRCDDHLTDSPDDGFLCETCGDRHDGHGALLPKAPRALVVREVDIHARAIGGAS